MPKIKNSRIKSSSANNELVSIIITTKNEEKNIARLLKSIKTQTHHPIETIVVDNNSTDKTIDIAKKFRTTVASYGPERSSQRNYGAKISHGKFLLFLDADMELSQNVITGCVEKIRQDIQNGGVVITEKSEASSFWEKVKAFERSLYNDKGDNITDAARFFRRSVFDQAGGYDETITGPEDWDLPETIIKLGYKICRTTELIYHHERIRSVFWLAKKKYYYALKAHRYLKKQNIPLVNPKTVYFLRPIFYHKWRQLAAHPVLTLAMITMLSVELISGGLGFVIGRIQNR